jgi:hypothetical protein
MLTGERSSPRALLAIAAAAQADDGGRKLAQIMRRASYDFPTTAALDPT